MSAPTSNIDTIQKATGAAATAFGVAGIVAPRLLSGTYGMKDRSDDFSFMGRLWGTRTAALGGLMLAAKPGSERRNIVLAATVLNALDVAIALTSGGLSGRTKVLAAATSAAFVAVGGVALASES